MTTVHTPAAPPIPVTLKFLWQAEVELAIPLDVGLTPRGRRHIVSIKGGRFEGPTLRGDVLPGGGDWMLVRPNGVAEVDIRATGRTDEGDLIYAQYRGLFRATPEVMQRIGRREWVDPSEYYFRVTATYETASEKHGRLNQVLAVGVGTFTDYGIKLALYDVL